jgi:aerobic-type carbon monoxide dehydrogenase small subunit (CoxS/CutS family)
MKITRSILHGAGCAELTFDGGDSLLDVVREGLGVRSASLGCRDGSCGTCRILLDGGMVNSCQVRWAAVLPGARVETYEDLAELPAASRAVAALGAERPTRCSLCVGALGVTAVALERAGSARDPEAIEAALSHATCMCTGRGSLRRALSKA